MRRLVCIFVVMALASTANAEREKKRTTAQVLSGVGTAVSSAIVVSGFLFAPDGQQFDKPLLYTGIATAVITPSFGEWYAGEWLTYGMAARVFGAGLATLALTEEMKTETCSTATMAGQNCTSLQGGGVALLGVAAIAFIGGMAYDVTEAAPTVDTWNSRHGFMIAPTAFVTPTGTTSGLVLAGRF